jgi:anti-sigma regulatory factor (Ser/Thr protein kinase)
VVDAGAGFEVATVAASPELAATVGHGRMLIRALADEFVVRRRRPNGTVLRVVQRCGHEGRLARC